MTTPTPFSEEPGAIKSSCATSVKAIKGCALLALPAEIRNEVWELAFTPATELKDEDGNNYINLIGARDPSPALLLTCHHIFAEAMAFFTQAIEVFWRATHFYIRAPYNDGPHIPEIEALDNDKLRKISKLTIKELLHYPRRRRHGVVPRLYKFERGVWTCIGRCCDSSNTGPWFSCPQQTILSEVNADVLNTSVQINAPYAVARRHPISMKPKLIDLDAELSEDGIKAVREVAGWPHLTTKELSLMVEWFNHY